MAITNDDFMKFLAAWQLIHEVADEGMKAAIARGQDQNTGEMSTGPSAFVDGLAAQVEILKEELKGKLSDPEATQKKEKEALEEQVARLAFEVGAIRGELQSINTALHALTSKMS